MAIKKTAYKNLHFAFFRILFIIASFWVFATHAGFIDESIEAGAYGILHKMITSSGKSNEYADCVVEVMKFTGATKDATDIRNIFQPEQLAKKLYDKMHLADFVCIIGGPIIFVLIVLILSCTCCICSCRLCCRPKPMIIQVAAMPRNISSVPYKQMETV